MIDKISNTIVNDKVKSVYSFNDYSIQDLLSKFFEQINSVTDLVNQNEEKINTQNFKLEEFINYMKNEGIPSTVIETVTTMYNDGRLTELFNNLANNILDVVEEFKNDINLEINKLKSKNIFYFSDWGKPNDENYDNSIPFYNCLKELCKRGGGELIIDSATWYFKKPIVIDFEVFGVTIRGMARGIQKTEVAQTLPYYGTTLIYNEGTTELFTFNKKCNQLTLEDFSLHLSDFNSFVVFNLTFHQGRIKNVRTYGGVKGITLNTGTYVEIDRFSFSTYSPYALYGISIGEQDFGYTTEFIYIKNSSINFGWITDGTGIKILRCQGGVWCENLDICNTKGIAIKIDNMIGYSAAYFNFDNNNFSGVGIGYYFKATNNIGGVYINNQRISLFSETVDERFIYCEPNTSGTTDLHVKNLYIRTRKSTIIPTYLMELRKINSESEIEITGGEPLNTPILLESGVRQYTDFRIQNICIDKTRLVNGTNNLFMSDKKCLLNKVPNAYFMPYVSGVYMLPCSQINFDIDGYPNAVITITNVDELPSGRMFIDFSGKIARQNYLPK